MKTKFFSSLVFFTYLFTSLSLSAQWRFVEHAYEAKWESSIIDSNSNALIGTTSFLTFGKKGTDKGEANLIESILEDNTRQYILFTHPKWSKNGTIKGWFPAIRRIPEGSRLKGEIGFVQPEGNPSTDGARFMIYAHYYINGQETWELVLDKHKMYTGSLETFNISLKKYENKKAYFELRVDAGESAGQDWAAWVDPRIEVDIPPSNNRFKKLKLTFLGAGYKHHNDDCSRMSLDVWSYAIIKDPYSMILPKDLDTQLVKWDQLEKPGVWIKRTNELVDYKFEINQSNWDKLKSRQESQIYNIDVQDFNEGKIELSINHRINFCHKGCDLCTDFKCGLKSGIISFNDYNVKNILSGNSFGYFRTQEIDSNGAHPPHRLYFKLETF